MGQGVGGGSPQGSWVPARQESLLLPVLPKSLCVPCWNLEQYCAETVREAKFTNYSMVQYNGSVFSQISNQTSLQIRSKYTL